MKRVLLSTALIALLAGCVVSPVPHGRVVVQPQVEVVYQWDPVVFRYYYVDRGHRRYMHRDWKHPHHPHGGPPGHRKHRDHRD